MTSTGGGGRQRLVEVCSSKILRLVGCKKSGILIASLELCHMCMLDEIRAKRDEIYAIARAHKAEKLWVFGSCACKKREVL